VSRPPGIHRQVDEHLAQLAAIGQDGAQDRSGRYHQLDVGRDEAAEQPAGILDHLADVQDGRLHHLLPPERQELLGEGGGAIRRLLDADDVLAARVAGGSLGQEEPAIPGDRGQDVVEIVCHPPGQLPDRIELLGMEQLGLDAPHLGDGGLRVRHLLVRPSGLGLRPVPVLLGLDRELFGLRGGLLGEPLQTERLRRLLLSPAEGLQTALADDARAQADRDEQGDPDQAEESGDTAAGDRRQEQRLCQQSAEADGEHGRAPAQPPRAHEHTGEIGDKRQLVPRQRPQEQARDRRHGHDQDREQVRVHAPGRPPLPWRRGMARRGLYSGHVIKVAVGAWRP
jgi:hypothetical protein